MALFSRKDNANDGTTDLIVGPLQDNARIYAVVMETDGTVGTATVTALLAGRTTYEPVFEEDGTTPRVIDLAVNSNSFSIPGFSITNIKFVFAAFNGTSFGATISAGD